MDDTPSSLPLVAVVIPVYNVERYLEECLTSVQQQDYPCWTAIVVIDGATDGSEAIARRFEESDERFRVFVTDNRGLGHARNVGFSQSSGDYVFWLDSDDVIPPGTLSALVETARETEAEVVAGYAEDFGVDISTTRYWTQRGSLYRGAVRTVSVSEEPQLLFDHVVWNKLYSRDFLQRESLTFPEGVHCEDIVFSARCALAANRTTILPRLVYRHRRHGAAISSSYTRDKTLGDWLHEADRAISVVEAGASRRALQQYLHQFIATQWWTRARALPSLDRDHFLGLTALSRRIHELLGGSSRRQLNPLHSALLSWLASEDPSSLRQVLNESPGVLDDAYGRTIDELHQVLAVAERLRSTPAGQALAQALIVERYLRPVADGLVELGPSNLTHVVAAINECGSELLQRVTASRAPAEEAVKSFLHSEGQSTAEVTVLRRTSRDLVLRGSGRAPYGAHDAQTANLVLSSESRAPVVAPVQWKLDREGGQFRFQARVALNSAPRDTRITMHIEFNRDAMNRGKVRLTPAATLPVEAHGSAETIVFPPSLLSNHSSPRRIFSIPAWRDNPFVTMLQTEPAAAGYELSGASTLHAVTDELLDRHREGAIHIHWPNIVIDGAPSAQNAESRVDAFLSALSAARANGRPIIWTVHNILPHEVEHRAAAVRLHQGIADRADAIHVMNSKTADAVSAEYTLPRERVVWIPHPTYPGVYGPTVERHTAREALGIDQHAKTALLFGQLRTYKGIDVLARSIAHAREREPKLRLLLAGKPVGSTADDLAQQLGGLSSHSTVAARFIEDSEVAFWFGAADVAVLPYRRILNSGALHLAATFGVPTVLPAEEHLVADFGDQEWIRFFNPTEPEDSISDLLVDDWYLDHKAVAAARSFAASRLPVTMSRSYLELLESFGASRVHA